jgi:CHAD domain-containing protein
VKGETPDPVHQMRVAVRRLRSALAIFRRGVPDSAFGMLDRDLKALAAKLGEARDWDVFLGGTGADVQLAFPDDKRIASLIAAGTRRRAAAYTALGAFVASDAFNTLSLRLALLPTVRPWDRTEDPDQAARLAAPCKDFAAAALHRLFKRLLNAGDGFAELPHSALHDVRKLAKRLRYGSEFFAPLFGAKAVKRFVKKLVDLQEALGAVNDGAVAAHLMAELEAGADRAFAVGVVRGYVAAVGAPAAAGAGKAWRKFTQASPFWG